MANRSGIWKLVLILAFQEMIPAAHAQQARVVPETTWHSELAVTGIRTDRFSPKQLRMWESIVQIIFARDESGRLTHPRLYSLWQSVEGSNHVIYVELRDPKARGDRQAGQFLLEKFDPEAQKHIAVIRLCLPVIDETLVKERIPGADGFVRFEKLGKKERYAEILGHELAHAVWTLTNPDNARMLEDLDLEVNEFHTCRHGARPCMTWDDQAQRHLQRIESLTTMIERPGEAAEAEIWRELVTVRKRRR